MSESDNEFDVIVVGAGGSGLACATEAASRGARVLVVEKAPNVGGTTSWAVGTYTSSATPHQERVGVDDDPDRHFADMDLVNAAAKRPDNIGLRRVMTREAPDTFRCLMDLGVEFIGPNPEPPHTRPRMHNIVPGAAALIYYLGRRCRQLGMTIQCNSSLDDIVIEDGRARGAVVSHCDGNQAIYRANRGIVLASGDFAASKDMRARYFDQAVVNAEPVYKHNTGDGFKIAERLGARIVNGDYTNFYIPRMRFVPPRKASWVVRLPPSKLVARLIQFGWNVMPQALMPTFIMQFVTTVLGPEPSLFKQAQRWSISPASSLRLILRASRAIWRSIPATRVSLSSTVPLPSDLMPGHTSFRPRPASLTPICAITEQRAVTSILTRARSRHSLSRSAPIRARCSSPSIRTITGAVTASAWSHRRTMAWGQ